VAAAAVVAVVAFTSAPLTLAVLGVRTGDHTQQLQRVTVTVDNTTGTTTDPRFVVSTGGQHPSGFWSPVGGRPLVLGPHASATVTLVAPHWTWSPQHGGWWLVEAYTSGPDALSTSSLQQWHLGVPQQ